MDANTKVNSARTGALRIAVSAALLSVMLSGCSSVPDAVNPVKWYEQTTDFFSGDNQAAETAANAPGGNQGLVADPAAPAPAPAPTEQVAAAPSGLSADQASGNYASPPIERQGAPTDVLRPQVAGQMPDGAPVPAAQPTLPVIAAPVAPPAPMTPMTPMTGETAPQIASAPPAAPQMPGSIAMPERPASMSMADAPPPPVFNPPANAIGAMGGDDFGTVVINSSGMDTMAPSQPTQRFDLGAQGTQTQSASSAMFPKPGTTTSGQVAMAAPAGMTRVATIHFANNSSMLDARDRSILGAVIQLQKERGGQVVVVGHASSRTRDMDYIDHQMVNFEVSMERAATIGNVLKDLGLSGEQLEVQAVSDTTPLYLEVMPSGEAGNRRVEIYLTL